MKRKGIITLLVSICLVLVLAVAACAPAPSIAPPPPPSLPPAPTPAPAPAPAPAPTPAPAPLSPAEFYAQNEITLVNNMSIGGGTDLGARIIASWWPFFVEGGRMVVKNIPGGGGIPGANYTWNAKPDGLTIQLTSPHSSEVPAYVFGTPGADFDVRQFNFLGDFGLNPLALEVPIDSPYDTIEDLKGVSGFRFAGSSPQSANSMVGVVLADVLGMTDLKMVLGFPGEPDIALSFQRHETDGTGLSMAGANTMLAKGVIKKPLVAMARLRSAYFPDTPALTEVADLTPRQFGMLSILESLMSSKLLWTGPDVPADRVAFLQHTLFDVMLHDKGVTKHMKYKWTAWAVRSPEEYKAVIDDLGSLQRADIDELIALMESYVR